jgi:lipoprotein-anchoring transpeptidase ErfK/SrfK
LELRFGKRLLDRFPVTVGSRTSPTPLGDYFVTDGLVGRGLGPWYGCCVLALSGHQNNLPSGWIGGNRIAIHGTPGSVGGAESHGCLRASDQDMISLFARVPLGTPVFIHS